MIRGYLSLVFALATVGTQALAQTSLADLVQEARADWMFGSWEATTDNGDGFALNVTWDLDKKVVVIHGKGSDMEFKGYTAIESGQLDPKYTGYDNRGTVSKGSWTYESGELVLRLEAKGPERTMKMAAVFAGSATDGLILRVHGVEASGALSEPAGITLKFKKKK